MLDAASIRYEVDLPAQAAGKLVLKLAMEVGDRPLRLTAHFPTRYPYFPPMVIAPDLELVRHQTPGSKQLCLLKRAGEDWAPATDTLAGLLVEQLPLVFASQPGTGNEASGEVVETQEGEPITAFIDTEAASFIGFPSYAFSRLDDHGVFRMGLERLKPLRGTVLDLRDADGNTIVSSEARDELFYTKRSAPIITGRWVRLPTRPPVARPQDYYDLAVQALPALQQPRWEILPGATKPRIDLIALLFEDELAWREQAGNVILISKTQEAATAGKRGKIEARVHRTELESRANYFMRDPMASGLKKGVVSLAGAGSIGSPAAKLLAQAGLGDLRIIDQDVLDAGNAIRWEIGRSGAGHPKAHLLHELIESNYPYTKVLGMRAKIGNPLTAGDPTERELDDALFRGVTCMLDATASIPVNHFLSETARVQGIPYVWMHATHGAWAGLVGRAGPSRADFCWMCHLYYLSDGQISRLPSAPEDKSVQPPGCLDPTFIGAQVDLAEVSLMGTRRVIDEVLTCVGAQANSAYPWNIAVVRLRDEQGQPQLPVWTPYTLPPHADCPNH